MSSAMLNDDAILPRKRPIPVRKAGADLLVQDPDTKKIHFLNPAAALVWDSCDGVTTVDECAAKLGRAFNTPPATDLAADVRTVVSQFVESGLLNV